MNDTRAVPSFVLERVAQTLNGALAADPEAKRLLATLTGRCVAVEVSDFGLVISVGIEDDRIRFGQGAETPDATVAGRLVSLMGAARSGNPRGLVVSGDAELVHGLARVMSRLPRAAWERVATILGAGPARLLERLAGSLTRTLADTRNRFAESVAEYLMHEARLVVPRYELEDFLADVDKLRTDVDRLAKRVERLARERRAAQ